MGVVHYVSGASVSPALMDTSKCIQTEDVDRKCEVDHVPVRSLPFLIAG